MGRLFLDIIFSSIKEQMDLPGLISSILLHPHICFQTVLSQVLLTRFESEQETSTDMALGLLS